MKEIKTEILEFNIIDNKILIEDWYISEEIMTKREFWEFISRLQEMYKELI